MAPEGNTLGYAAQDESGHLAPWKFNRRELRDNDVEFDVKFCGICHSDYHQIKGDWGSSSYPMVPGHELAGIVTKVGSKVTNFKVGQHVGVGCMVDSCLDCDACQKKEEQYCEKVAFTYNSTNHDGTPTYGGYSNRMVCREEFILDIPESIPLDKAAPLLCAGITVYSPLMHFGMNEAGKSLGVVGLGGLGHMAVKIGKAMGLKVVILSRSDAKKEEAMGHLKADDFWVTKDEKALQERAKSLDYIVDTVSATHDIGPYINLLKVDGKIVVVGMPTEPYAVVPQSLVMGRKMLAGSLIGGVKETQECLDFCGKHNVTPDIEVINMDYVNKAMERLHNSDVKYRFVIDMASLKE